MSGDCSKLGILFRILHQFSVLRRDRSSRRDILHGVGVIRFLLPDIHPIIEESDDTSHPQWARSSRNNALQKVVGAISDMLPALNPTIEGFDHTFAWALQIRHLVKLQ